MKKVSLLALAAFVSLSTVLACSSSDGGSSSGAVEDAASDAGDEGTPTDAPADVVKDTAPPPAECANHAAVSKEPACDTCTKGACCDEILACDNDAKCKALQECLAGCKLTDLSCSKNCETTAGPDATDRLKALSTCARRKCASACG